MQGPFSALCPIPDTNALAANSRVPYSLPFCCRPQYDTNEFVHSGTDLKVDVF
jgi:hypothetical protein